MGSFDTNECYIICKEIVIASFETEFLRDCREPFKRFSKSLESFDDLLGNLCVVNIWTGRYLIDINVCNII